MEVQMYVLHELRGITARVGNLSRKLYAIMRNVIISCGA